MAEHAVDVDDEVGGPGRIQDTPIRKPDRLSGRLDDERRAPVELELSPSSAK